MCGKELLVSRKSMSDTVVIQGEYLINIHWPLHAGDVLPVVLRTFTVGMGIETRKMTGKKEGCNGEA